MESRAEAPIFKAIRENNVKEVRELVKANADLTALTLHNEREITPIQLAAFTNNWGIVRLIASEKPSKDNNINGPRYGSALYFAVLAGEHATAITLLNAGANLSWVDPQGQNALFIAIEAKHKLLISLLLSKESLSRINTSEQTPMMLAASLAVKDPEYIDIIKFIADNTKEKINKNDAGNFGYILSFVVKNTAITNKIALVKSLLAAGAAVDFQDELGNTCLHHAVEQHNEKLIAVLVAKGANPGLQNEDGLTPIDLACQYNLGNLALTLIKHNKNTTDYNKALLFAITHQNQIVTQKLIDAGANCDVYDCEKGNIFIYQALINDNVDILGMLANKLDLRKMDVTQHGMTVMSLAYQLNAYQCQQLITRIISSEIITPTPARQYSSPVGAQKTFLKKLDETISNSNWWIKKPSMMFWLDDEWLNGWPGHIRQIKLHLNSVMYNNPVDIHDAFFNIMNILLNLAPSTKRHPDTIKFDDETKHEMLAMFNQLYQPDVSVTLDAQQQMLNQAAMTYTYVTPTYPYYNSMQPVYLDTHSFAQTHVGIYPTLQAEQPPPYHSYPLSEFTMLNPHDMSNHTSTTTLLPTDHQSDMMQSLTDSYFPPVPTHALNMPGIGMFQLKQVQASTSNAVEKKQISLLS